MSTNDGDVPEALVMKGMSPHVKYNPKIAAEAWGKIDEFFERTILAR